MVLTVTIRNDIRLKDLKQIYGFFFNNSIRYDYDMVTIAFLEINLC